MKCQRCKGTGISESEECDWCDGTGEVCPDCHWPYADCICDDDWDEDEDDEWDDDWD